MENNGFNALLKKYPVVIQKMFNVGFVLFVNNIIKNSITREQIYFLYEDAPPAFVVFGCLMGDIAKIRLHNLSKTRLFRL